MKSNKNNKSRTQRKSRNGKTNMIAMAGPSVWALGNGKTELKCYTNVSGNFQLFHNIGAPYFNVTSLLDSITTGTALGNRIGNRINVRELDIILVLNNKADRPNVTYRFVIVAAPSTVTTDDFSELFSGGGITGAHLPTGSTLLHDSYVPLNQGSTQLTSGAAGKERSFVHRATIPLSRPVVYSPANGACSTRLTGWIVAYDAFGTLITDNIASVANTSFRILFTDE